MHLLKKGIEVKNVQDLPGHFRIKAILRYLHVARKDLLKYEKPS